MAPKKNGFWYFMLEYKKTAEENGKSFPGGFREIQSDPECSQQWSALSDQEKKKYNDRAKGDNGSSAVAARTSSARPKMTNWGETIANVEAREKKKADYDEDMRREIEETIQLAAYSKKIPELSFFFLHVNYFYTKEGLDGSIDYIPAEIAICEFSLEYGCKQWYHQIINIDVELGYRRELMEHAEDSHKLQPDYEKGEKDYQIILKKFQNILHKEMIRTGKMPPVYAAKSVQPIVKCFLERLKKTADDEGWKGTKEIANLYSLEILFGKLMAVTNPDIAALNCNTSVFAEAEFEKGAFEFAPNIECEFHQKIEDGTLHCSLAAIRRWIYLICDYCCPRLGINMLQDVHCPIDSNVDDVELLTTHLSDVNLAKERRVGYVKSATGVTQAHREARAARTKAEEEIRRIEAAKRPLTIIDHSQPQSAGRHEAPPAVFTKPLRVPKPATIADGGVAAASGGAGRGKYLNLRYISERGRGRGGIPSDN